MPNLIQKFFGGHNDGMLQKQREALVDLLVMSLYADNLIRTVEEEGLREKLATLHWESSKPLEYYLNEAITRVRDVRSSPEALDGFIEFASERLQTKSMREKAWEWVNQLFYCDRQLSERESQLARKIQVALGIRHS